MASINVVPGPAAPPPEGDASRMKSEFLANLNYEIRTPLSGILGMTDLLLETGLDQDQGEYVAAIRMCAEELLEQLNSALEFSAIAAGQLRLEESDFNLVETLRGVAAQHQEKAEAKGLRLVTRLEAGLPEVVAGDAVRLRQVISGLLDIAVKFTSHGEVELEASGAPSRGGWVELRLSIRAGGIGLARRQSTPALGLALAGALVRVMRGELRVENRSAGAGALRVSVPLRVSAELLAPVLAPEEGLAPKRILVVEDDVVSRRIVRHILERGAYQIDSAATGEAAVEAAGRQPYDLILMDLQMPGMDGFEATRNIRKLPGYARVPVIALTAHTGETCRAQCLEQGMQGFLPKPVRAEELLAAVRRLTANG